MAQVATEVRTGVLEHALCITHPCNVYIQWEDSKIKFNTGVSLQRAGTTAAALPSHLQEVYSTLLICKVATSTWPQLIAIQNAEHCTKATTIATNLARIV
jgi:hypothetical protein